MISKYIDIFFRFLCYTYFEFVNRNIETEYELDQLKCWPWKFS